MCFAVVLLWFRMVERVPSLNYISSIICLEINNHRLLLKWMSNAQVLQHQHHLWLCWHHQLLITPNTHQHSLSSNIIIYCSAAFLRESERSNSISTWSNWNWKCICSMLRFAVIKAASGRFASIQITIQMEILTAKKKLNHASEFKANCTL